MSYLAASGFCLAALVGSFIYENRRMKKEAEMIRKHFKRLIED